MGEKIDNRVRKLVSFNKKKKDEAEMLKHVSRRNFSGYMKKLIRQDMLRIKQEKLVNEIEKEPTATMAEVPRTEVLKKEEPSIIVKTETNEDKLSRLKNELRSGSSGVYIPTQPKKH